MRRELSVFFQSLGEIEKLRDLLSSDISEDERVRLAYTVKDRIRAINLGVYGCELLSEYPVNIEEGLCRFQRQTDKWIFSTRHELEKRSKIIVKTDYDFHNLTVHIANGGKDALVNKMITGMQKIQQTDASLYQRICNAYNEYHYFWGKIDLDEGITELFDRRAVELIEHLDDFIWLYNELADYRSKRVLYKIMYFWIYTDYANLSHARENNFYDYYDYDLISCSQNEVFVDLGAYTGDSTLSFIENYGSYKKIYCYEMVKENAELLSQNLSSYSDIIIKNVGVYNRCGEMFILEHDGDDSSNRMSSVGKTAIKVVSLDEDIMEPITFIKMDIEGSEVSALEGAKKHIQNEKPKLAVCSYHTNSHIWEVPRKMRELNHNYKLYMRYNGLQYSPIVSEYVTFGI